MNILFVSESLWMSGVVFDLHMMAEGLALRGHRVFAVDPGGFGGLDTPRSAEPEFQDASRIYPEAEIKLLSVPVKGRRSEDIVHRRSISEYARRYRQVHGEIEKLVRREKIDVILLYSAARCGVQAVRIARKHGIPIVFRNVDMLNILWPTRARRLAVRLCERYVYSRVHRLLALTPNYADYLVRNGATRNRIDILPFPMDLEQFQPQEPPEDLRQKWRLKPEDKVIVFIGALYQFGSLIETVREFPRILAAEPRARFLIVGDGPLRLRLEELVDELNVNEQAYVVGPEPFARMPDYIALATICISCFPITDFTKDIFSAKIVQYLACGKPTVAPALPGTMRMLPGEETGVEYAKDAHGLADKVIALLSDPEECGRKAVVGLAYVKRVHDQHAVVGSLERILTGIVESRRG